MLKIFYTIFIFLINSSAYSQDLKRPSTGTTGNSQQGTVPAENTYPEPAPPPVYDEYDDEDIASGAPPPISPQTGSDSNGAVFMGVPQVERESLPATTGTNAETAIDKPGVAGETPTTRSLIEERMQRKKVAKEIATPLFGAYRIHLMAQQPKYQNSEKYYDLVYKGKPAPGPAFAVDYFFFDSYVTLGLTFRFAFFNDNGRAAQKNADGSFQEDLNGQKVSWSVMALQGGLAAQATPFSFKWLVLSGWFGAERAVVDESRENLASGDAKDDKKVYTNRYIRTSVVSGGALSFRIDSFDQQSSSSLSVIGLRGIYLSPYIEIVRYRGPEVLHVSRNVYGLGFTFETIK